MLKKGMIVRYGTGWGRLTRVTKYTVNIGGVWGQGKITKGVPINEVVEDAEGFYERWRKSESYQCM